ncbi:hypothetical protein EUTSA_v10022485mg, partial [Eutrema salsugineum]
MIMMVVMMMVLVGTIGGNVNYLPKSPAVCVEQCRILCSDREWEKNCIAHCISYNCRPPSLSTNIHHL